MTRVISVVSGKGGVGKTTVTCNLGVKLSQMDNEVLIIDGNFSGANVAQHFGLGFQEVSLNEVMSGDAYITQAVAKHPAGVSVLPASILDFNANSENLKHSLVEFLGDKDFVFIDAAAGVGDEVESAIEASDEVLLVSEPELPSLTNCIGAKKIAEELDRDVLGMVLNGVREEAPEVGIAEAEELVEVPVIGHIDDHEHVRESIALREPLTSVRPEAKVSRQIESLAHRMQGREPPERALSEKVRLKFKDLMQ